LRIDCDRWSTVQVCTTQENHGGGKHVIPVRYRLRPRDSTRVLLVAAAMGVAAVAFVHALVGVVAGGFLLSVCLVEWRRSLRRAATASGVFDAVAATMGLVACQKVPARPIPDSKAPSPDA
jgi:hypothetical protein